MKTDEQVGQKDKPEFCINSSYQAFTQRQKNVFDQLTVVEHSTKDLLSKNEVPMDMDDTPATIIDPEEVRTRLHADEPKTKHFRGKDSIFKRPQARPPRSIPYRKTPDYQVNPHKWTRYTLDVPNEDMSERANTAAALSFLKEMKFRKQLSDDTDADELPQRIVFKKAPEKKLAEAVVENAPAVFRNTKVVMPEYVVGGKITKQKKQKKRVEGGSIAKEVKLDHLLEGEDD